MEFSRYTCEAFIDQLASKAPVPGGGGASALAGAVGTALGNMVGSLTLGKAKYVDVQDTIQSLKSRADGLQRRLLDLMQRDAEVFEPLAAAYRMPKETPEQAAEKERVMQAALRECCEVPLAIMGACCEAIELLESFAAIGARIALSDAGVGAALCGAALRGASLNIYINTKSILDRPYAEKANGRANELISAYAPRADAVFEQVRRELAG